MNDRENATRSPVATAVALRPPSGLALRNVLNLTSQVLCVCDPEGRLLWCNLGFERALGYALDGVRGTPLAALADDDGQHVLDSAGRTRSGRSNQGEVAVTARMRRRDGVWRRLEWTVRADDQRGLRFFAGRDVTDRLAAEEAVRAGEARLRAIVSHSPAVIFVKGLDSRYLLANEAWTAVMGRSVEQVIGRSDTECQPDNAPSLDEVEELLRLSLDDREGEGGVAGGGPDHPSQVRDLRLETPDGPRHFMLSLFPLYGEDGHFYATCGIATDITERKRAEAALQARQVVLDTILATSPDIISLLDSEGRVRHVSQAEQQILGYQHRPPSNSELFSLVHPDDFDDVASAFIGMVTGSRPHLHVRYRVLHAEGHWVTLDSRAQAVADDEGRFLGGVVVTRDVSARLDSETRLRELRQAAEQASRAKSEFLSRMSHELRTPLNAILGFSQLLEMDDLALPQAEAVDHILRAGRHLLQLIDEVLDIARIETGHLELAVRAVLLADVVAEAIDAVRTMAERAEVSVQNTIDRHECPAVLADRQRLLQVLVNLLSNAVKYNRPGGRVDIFSEPAPGGRVRLAVADTGQGIRAEDLSRVFEPFDRLGAEQSGVDGTGVGLALAKHLVERMNGTIAAESVPEVGSTFSLELPMAVVPDDVSSGGSNPGGGTGVERSGSAGTRAVFRVLLVEEDLSSRELVERVLARRPGVVLLAAREGQRALELARQERPDLVLLDLQLPDMPGSTLLDRLGEDPACASTPVAVLSTEAGPGQVRRLLGRGVAGQLTKPIDVRALLSLVDAARAASGK